MSTSPSEVLRHILDECDYLLRHSAGLDKNRFLLDETLKRAFVRSIEIIGEASKQLPPTLKNQNTQVEWKAISGMRDRLIHGYFGVDYEIVWDVIDNKIPVLQQEVKRMIHEAAQDH